MEPTIFRVRPAVDIVDLRKSYPGADQPVHALRGVTLSIAPATFVAVMGASGSGKSTLLHLVAGLDDASGGSVIVEGCDLAAMSDRERTLFRRRRLGVIFQAYNLLPQLTALENVALPLALEGGYQRETRHRATQLLNDVGLGQRVNHRPAALSGGEQQRVAVARALMNDPALILADEPTGNLDSRNGGAIWRLLTDLVRAQGRTLLAVTHEPAGAAVADRIVLLKDGALAGEFEPNADGQVSHVASRYAELVG